MAKKTTLNEIGEMLERVVKHMLTKEDGEKFATKDQVLALQTQVNSIERQLQSVTSRRHDADDAKLRRNQSNSKNRQ